uniref:Uncharacterized protein n=1 Tax=Oryza rufipogon TaxID=4529 RepID=A0A0E0Q2E6_ORYRU
MVSGLWQEVARPFQRVGELGEVELHILLVQVTRVSHSSPPNGTTWMSTARLGRNTMLVRPAPWTPIITSAELTRRAKLGMSVWLSGSAMRTSNLASAAACAMARSLRKRRELLREMMRRRGLSRRGAPVRDATARSRRKVRRRRRLKSATVTPPGERAGSMPMARWNVAPMKIRGKQCTSWSLSTSMTSYRESCRNSGVNLSSHQSLIPLSKNCTSPPKWLVLVKSGTSTLPAKPPLEKRNAGTEWLRVQSGGTAVWLAPPKGTSVNSRTSSMATASWRRAYGLILEWLPSTRMSPTAAHRSDRLLVT